MPVPRGPLQKGPGDCYALALAVQRVHHPPQEAHRLRDLSDMHQSMGKRQVKTLLGQLTGKTALKALQRRLPASLRKVWGALWATCDTRIRTQMFLPFQNTMPCGRLHIIKNAKQKSILKVFTFAKHVSQHATLFPEVLK
ncbi:hypothetical protein TraAM80_03221 [Trypanosoma rangeli]|uniref:Uncharacterized protein n=1 Tax=Trypanosoma rangeli TaxID=5698 RepID=A0A3R7MKV8_TRYRA|nr:uncharacterized protein TraAM80_03221 [Trypanosoma rangeli]RNF07699.1 hypothetical protein TraAM80_03221 [Trypanosoma rangeli]|eukprot:RNF07699.1 hypothetical protein TraAM80_03221 [Trypanosoma rangeli]